MTTHRIRLMHGTAEALAAKNPALLAGEMCIEIDTGKFKVGDGVKIWSTLDYVGGGLSAPVADGKVYMLKNGEWAEAMVVKQPEVWAPVIDDMDDLELVLGEDMTPYQLTGNNAEINI